MRVLASIMLLCFLAGCGARAGEEAERQYRIAERNGDPEEELCKRKAIVAEGYLKDGDEAQYKDWKLRADTCAAHSSAMRTLNLK